VEQSSNALRLRHFESFRNTKKLRKNIGSIPGHSQSNERRDLLEGVSSKHVESHAFRLGVTTNSRGKERFSGKPEFKRPARCPRTRKVRRGGRGNLIRKRRSRTRQIGIRRGSNNTVSHDHPRKESEARQCPPTAKK